MPSHKPVNMLLKKKKKKKRVGFCKYDLRWVDNPGLSRWAQPNHLSS